MDYSYVAYIDESGDDGLARVRPIDANGASEWLIVSAVVIRAEREHETMKWVRNMVANLTGHQRKGIHFSHLSPPKREYVCRELAKLPVRCFVVASNKKNMRGYTNPNAAKIPSRNWFYCWMTRILLERVTFFAEWQSVQDHGEPRKIKIEYSERGGMSYTQMTAYYQWLQSKTPGAQFIPWGDLRYSVLDYDLFKVFNHTERAGLQLADIVAGSFYKGCDIHMIGACDPTFAKLLRPRMAVSPDQGNLIAGYGVKLLPGFRAAKLLQKQQEIFQFYGYPKRQWWASAPSTP